MFRKNKQPVNLPRRPGASSQPRQQVFSYHANRSSSEQNTGRHPVIDERIDHSRSFIQKIQNLPIILSVLVMVFALLYTLSSGTKPLVSIVDNSSTSLKHDAGVYQAYASELLRKSLFNQFKLTLDTSHIEQQMRQRFPEIETAEITIPVLGRQPKLELTTITPAFLLSTREAQTYYIASDGRATAPSQEYAAKPVETLVVQDQSGLPVRPGGQILTTDTVRFINEVIAQMKVKEVPIASFELPPNPYELRMRLTGEKYYVKFNMLGEARQQSGALVAVRNKLMQDKQLPSEYIDVRVDGKVFYK